MFALTRMSKLVPAMAYLLAGVVVLSACENRKRRAIEVQPEKVQKRDQDNDDITRTPGRDDFRNDRNDRNDRDLPNKDTAELRAVFTEEQLQKYVDINGKLEYEFDYLGKHKKEGEVQFEDGKAEITFADLTVGESGTLSLKIFEDGELALEGEREDLTLRAGKNNVSLRLREVDGGDDNGGDDNGGGDDKAELILSLEIEGSDGDEGETDPDPDNVQFQVVQEIAAESCVGAGCHGNRDSDDPRKESYWKGEDERSKDTLTSCLQGGCPDFSGPMPIAGTSQASTFGQEQRNLVLKYMSQN